MFLIQGRGPVGKKSESNQKHSIEIFASVAGELSEKSDSSLHTDASCGKNLHDTCDRIISMKEVEEGQVLNDELLQLGSLQEKTFACNLGFQHNRQEDSLNGSCCDRDDFNSEINPTSKDFSQSGMLNSDKKRAFDDSNFVPDVTGVKVGIVTERKVEGEPAELKIRSVNDETITVTCCSKDLMKLEGKSPQLVGPGHNVRPSLSMDCKNQRPFAQHTGCVLISADDDENSLGSAHPNTMVKALGPPPGAGNNRIKKISETSHWRIAPDVKEGNYSSTGNWNFFNAPS